MRIAIAPQKIFHACTRFHQVLATIPQLENIITTNWDDFFEVVCHAVPFVTGEDFIFWNTAGRKGFTAYLTLPAAVVSALGLVRRSGGSAVLGDGAASQFDVCTAKVEWGGTWRPELVYIVGNDPLLGMRALAGHKLVIDVVPGGLVEIFPLP